MVDYKSIGLVNTREMFKRAINGGYAIPAFNFNNMEQLQAIIKASSELKSPVILQVSKGARNYANQTLLRYMAQGAVEYAKELGCNHPEICLHLDHGDTFEICKSCVDFGFSSVMIDGSSLPYDENVALTKRVVEYAHQFDVTVEGELGVLAGVEDDVQAEESHYTKPEEVIDFVTKSIMEVVDNYDVEGVHIDDYFYPYGKIPYEREEQDFLKYRTSADQNFEDWRRSNVDVMIKNIHDELKKSFSKTGKKVLFGISPFAIYRTNTKVREDGWDKGSFNAAGALQCYSELYSDVYKWMKEGWIDYVVPQVYFPFERADVTYHDLTKWWSNLAKETNTILYIGQALYQMGSNEVWQNPKEMENQLKFNCQFDQISGTIFFTYKDLVPGQNPIKDEGLKTIKALWVK